MINKRSEKTESEQVAFFDQSYERFLRAKGSVGGESRFYRVGGRIVCLTFAGDSLVPYITPALEHLRVPPKDPDLTLGIWDTRSTGVQMVPPPCAWGGITRQGEVWGFNSRRIRFAFHWSDYSVNLLDHATRTGMYWVPDARVIPSWAQAVPLRTFFHWWLEANGCQILHGAAVGTDDGAVLLTGRSGKGKSTAALSCLRSGMHYFGDDCVIVRLEPEPFVYSLYCAAKLNAEDLSNFPALAGLVRNPEQAGREKQVVFLYPQFERQLAPEMRLRAIVLPQIADRSEASISPAPSWKARRGLTSISELQLPHLGRRAGEFIDRLCATLPAYTLDAGRSLHATPPAMATLLSRPAEAPLTQPTPPRDDHDPRPTPLLSVVVAACNAERQIKDAVEHALGQDYAAVELIVVDGGSADRTLEIVSRLPYDLRWFAEEHAGTARAWNRGIREASGAFLAFLDVHDRWPDNTLRRLVDVLVHDLETDVVYGRAQFVRQNPDTDEYEPVGEPLRETEFRAAAAVFRKSAFSKVGPFDDAPASAHEHDWFLRAAKSGARIRRVEEATVFVTRRGVDTAGGAAARASGALRLKETLDRRRARQARAPGSA